MNKITMFCLSLNPNHLDLIQKLNYTPVGLGKLNFNKSWITDKAEKEISSKNEFYGEYTFHYKLWKNNFITEKNWIGFCQYRKFWSEEEINNQEINFSKFNSKILHDIPDHLNNYETIIGNSIHINQFKFSKFVKKNIVNFIAKPSLIFFKNKRNIKFHFDMMHGEGNLDKAISVMDSKDKNDFIEYVNTEVSFSPHNMFICKNKNILMNYYNSLFPWLEECEKVFGFRNLTGYGLKRIYGFLAERYMSFWFKKYTKYYLMPIYFKDISDFSYKDL